MKRKTGKLKRLIREVHEQISKIDPFVTQVLQAHFLVEKLIDAILDALAKSPEHLRRNSSFGSKVRLIRAFAPSGNDEHWDLIAAMTSVRNEVAHKFYGPKRDEAMSKLRKVLEDLASNDNDSAEIVGADYDVLLVCTAELQSFLKSLLCEVSGQNVERPLLHDGTE